MNKVRKMTDCENMKSVTNGKQFKFFQLSPGYAYPAAQMRRKFKILNAAEMYEKNYTLPLSLPDRANKI